jgi:hypothetical protein
MCMTEESFYYLHFFRISEPQGSLNILPPVTQLVNVQNLNFFDSRITTLINIKKIYPKLGSKAKRMITFFYIMLEHLITLR